ncbi:MULTISPECIES: hypothetical protein [unclassified Acinetobacter]|uniref:hypothetical protein n=1 Tax=unclassified Acinetobacter TaxID=196816 RepID=UPI0018AA7313|nr:MULTISPECIES: hypothetical protein [unclassified Acinetobacter]MBJ9952688.1 hypothetical protein [Acinetobacter baumannii]
MGHYSNLRISSNLDQTQESVSSDEIYIQVKYAIPIFWLVLFKAEDIHALQNEEGLSYYVFRATILKSCETFKSRLNIWSALYNDEKVEILAQSFLQYLQRTPTFSVELNMTDIMGMMIDPLSIEAKNEMLAMINFIEEKYRDPSCPSPSKYWLPKSFELKTPQNRYLDIDGLGESLLPCTEVDAWLKRNETLNDSVENKFNRSFGEAHFYQILLSKQETSSNIPLNFKHRFLFLTRIKNRQLRKWLFQIFCFNEILFFFLLWLSLCLISIFLVFEIKTFSYLEITGIAIGLIALSYFIFQKMVKRIYLLKN